MSYITRRRRFHVYRRRVVRYPRFRYRPSPAVSRRLRSAFRSIRQRRLARDRASRVSRGSATRFASPKFRRNLKLVGVKKAAQ